MFMIIFSLDKQIVGLNMSKWFHTWGICNKVSLFLKLQSIKFLIYSNLETTTRYPAAIYLLGPPVQADDKICIQLRQG